MQISAASKLQGMFVIRGQEMRLHMRHNWRPCRHIYKSREQQLVWHFINSGEMFPQMNYVQLQIVQSTRFSILFAWEPGKSGGQLRGNCICVIVVLLIYKNVCRVFYFVCCMGTGGVWSPTKGQPCLIQFAAETDLFWSLSRNPIKR